MPYQVWIGDNYHYQDDAGWFLRGTYDDAEAALAHARQIIDACLEDTYRPGMTADMMYEQYVMFGDDASVNPIDGSPEVEFSGWVYARMRCVLWCDPIGARPRRIDP